MLVVKLRWSRVIHGVTSPQSVRQGSACPSSPNYSPHPSLLPHHLYILDIFACFSVYTQTYFYTNSTPAPTHPFYVISTSASHYDRPALPDRTELQPFDSKVGWEIFLLYKTDCKNNECSQSSSRAFSCHFVAGWSEVSWISGVKY
jgi:hypothetical protein